jgi:hypothetical protein
MYSNKEQSMKYTLITKSGNLYTFYVKAVADLYQQCYGGTLFTDEILIAQNTEMAV